MSVAEYGFKVLVAEAVGLVVLVLHPRYSTLVSPHLYQSSMGLVRAVPMFSLEIVHSSWVYLNASSPDNGSGDSKDYRVVVRGLW